MPEWLLSVIAFVVVTAILTFFVIRKRNDEWEGELIKKKHIPGDMETQETYKLIFKTVDGKKKRFDASYSDFKSWEVGDRAKKTKGEFHPQKV